MLKQRKSTDIEKGWQGMTEELREQLELLLVQTVGRSCVRSGEPMKKHTTFRIGGPAALFVVPSSMDMIPRLLQICQEADVPWFILGNGSNLLVSDEGFPGVVIQIDSNLQSIQPCEADSASESCVLRAEAGALLSKLAACARDLSLEGLEFASGIPGTLGGAVTMNAGAYGGEMKQVLRRVRVLDGSLQDRVLDAEELDLGYRTSRIQREGWIVLEAELELKKGDREQISARMEELREARVSKQPLEYPSAGSTFKRPEGYFAGKLIMDAGLAGFRVGDAQVSEKHCGFVINRGKAAAEDVACLIREVQDTVYRQFGVRLEPEVRFLGFGQRH